MNEAVKKYLDKIRQISSKIEVEATYISELLDDVNESEDLPSIEMSLDNIVRWSKEAHDVCRHTYDEFEEE